MEVVHPPTTQIRASQLGRRSSNITCILGASLLNLANAARRAAPAVDGTLFLDAIRFE